MGGAVEHLVQPSQQFAEAAIQFEFAKKDGCDIAKATVPL